MAARVDSVFPVLSADPPKAAFARTFQHPHLVPTAVIGRSRFDCFVNAHQEREWYIKAECLGGQKIDYQLDFHRLLNTDALDVIPGRGRRRRPRARNPATPNAGGLLDSGFAAARRPGMTTFIKSFDAARENVSRPQIRNFGGCAFLSPSRIVVNPIPLKLWLDTNRNLCQKA